MGCPWPNERLIDRLVFAPPHRLFTYSPHCCLQRLPVILRRPFFFSRSSGRLNTAAAGLFGLPQEAPGMIPYPTSPFGRVHSTQPSFIPDIDILSLATCIHANATEIMHDRSLTHSPSA